MAKQSKFLLLVIVIFLFIQCKRESLQITPLVKALSDYESNDGEIRLNIKGGKAPYLINWSNGSADSTQTNLLAGVYYVTVTDARKNTIKDTIEVTQPPWPLCIDTENNSYKTAIFGDQTWMIENLRSSKTADNTSIANLVYNNIDSNALIYGRLYTWQAAMNDSTFEKAQGICPDGWHIPSNEEWTLLIDNLTSFENEIHNLEKTLDLSYAGFYNNQFYGIGSSVSFWTSTQASNNVWKLYFNKNLSKAFRYHENRNNAISVRCIKN